MFAKMTDGRGNACLRVLHNPLALVKFPKIRKEGTPAIITRQQTADLLCAIYRFAPENRDRQGNLAAAAITIISGILKIIETLCR